MKPKVKPAVTPNNEFLDYLRIKIPNIEEHILSWVEDDPIIGIKWKSATYNDDPECVWAIRHDYPDEEISTFDDIRSATCPQITYLQYRVLSKIINESKDEEFGYYGEVTLWKSKSFSLNSLFTLLIEKRMLIPAAIWQAKMAQRDHEYEKFKVKNK
jgi:hypothetical protein